MRQKAPALLQAPLQWKTDGDADHPTVGRNLEHETEWLGLGSERFPGVQRCSCASCLLSCKCIKAEAPRQEWAGRLEIKVQLRSVLKSGKSWRRLAVSKSTPSDTLAAQGDPPLGQSESVSLSCLPGAFPPSKGQKEAVSREMTLSNMWIFLIQSFAFLSGYMWYNIIQYFYHCLF